MQNPISGVFQFIGSYSIMYIVGEEVDQKNFMEELYHRNQVPVSISTNVKAIKKAEEFLKETFKEDLKVKFLLNTIEYKNNSYEC